MDLLFCVNLVFLVDLKMSSLTPRMICDPIVYYDRLQNLCREGATASPAREVDFLMTARRTTDVHIQTIVDEPRFCSQHETYALFSNNRWMK